MRLEFIAGSSRKFWEARLQRRELIVRSGRIGSGGQTTPHSFGDEAAARAERDKLVREKTRKGYTIIEHDIDAPAPVAVAGRRRHRGGRYRSPLAHDARETRGERAAHHRRPGT